MTLALTRVSLQTLTATITAHIPAGPKLVTAPVDYPLKRIAPETLPLALAWPSTGVWRLLDSETQESDRLWEEWFFVAPLSNENDVADLNSVTNTILDLMQAAAAMYMKHPNLLLVGDPADYRSIQYDQGPLHDSGLITDLKYAGLTYRGFKTFLRIIEREPTA